MNEHDAARLITTGKLQSPTQFGNFVLVAIRVTGTGTAERSVRNETVFRDPAIWLTDATLDRVNGIPVIVQHPKGSTLNSEEYTRRAVGNVQFAYIANRDGFANAEGPDVWAVARVYDDDIIEAMTTRQLSTSPAVVFRPSDGNTTVPLGDGMHMLIEGDPSLIDHLAICPNGVWDKGEGPSGIRIDNVWKESTMTEEEMAAAADKARKDNDSPAAEKPPANDPLLAFGQQLDKVLAGLDSCAKRLDAIEAGPRGSDLHDDDGRLLGGGEPRRVAADAAKDRMTRDAEEREEHIAKLDTQARADSLFRAHGSAAPPSMVGETLLGYRRRLARQMQRHSKEFAKIDLDDLKAGDAFDAIEQKIYADAAVASMTPEVAPKTLREITKIDPHTGVRVTTFHSTGGHTFIGEMNRPGRRAHINLKVT